MFILEAAVSSSIDFTCIMLTEVPIIFVQSMYQRAGNLSLCPLLLYSMVLSFDFSLYHSRLL